MLLDINAKCNSLFLVFLKIAALQTAKSAFSLKVIDRIRVLDAHSDIFVRNVQFHI